MRAPVNCAAAARGVCTRPRSSDGGIRRVGNRRRRAQLCEYTKMISVHTGEGTPSTVKGL